MRRGTRVGQAYVAITADGSEINKDITDAFDDVDYKSIGNEHGKTYADRIRAHLGGLDKDFSALTDRVGNRLSSRLAKAIETDSALDDGVARMLANAFQNNKLDDLVRHVGRRAGVQFGGEFDKTVRAEVLNALEGALQKAVRSGDLDLGRILRGVNSGGGQVEIFGPVIDDAVRSVANAQRRLRVDYEAMWQKLLDQREKEEKAYTRYLGSEERTRLKEAARAAAERLRMQERESKEAERHAKSYTAFWERALSQREKDERRVATMQIQAMRMNEKHQQGLLDGAGRTVSRNRGLGDIVGKMLGEGSRNDALHFLGRTMGNIVTLTERASRFATGFATGMRSASEGASLVQRLMSGLQGGAQASGLARALSSVAAAGPAAAAALGAVLVAASLLASAAGALLAIVTALASTIASALVGALLVAAPLLMALVAAGGLVTAAFTSMTNAQRAYLFSAFQPLKAAFTGIGQIIFTEFTQPLYNGQSAIQVWSSNLQRAMLPLAGVAKLTAGAFAQAGNTITAALSGPGFQRFFNSLGSELPTIITRLASALGGFLNGVAGMFAAVMPYVTQFAGYLDRTAQSFSKWANSAKGQNAIADFAARAVDSLKHLWGFVREFSGFVSDVLFNPAAQRAGSTIFDGLRDAFARFRKAIARGDLEKWFSDAIQFGGTLWSVVSALGETFMALYNSGVLEGLGFLLGALATSIQMMNSTLEPAINLLGYAFPAAIAAAMTPMMAMAASVIAVGEALEWVASLLGMGNGAENPFRGFTDIASMWGNVVRPSGPGGRIQGPPLPPGVGGFNLPKFNLPELIGSGNTALNNTYEKHGGYMPNPSTASGKSGKKMKVEVRREDTEWQNPYLAFANSILKTAPKLAAEIRKTARDARKMLDSAMVDSAKALGSLLSDANKSFSSGVADAAKSTDAGGILASFQSLIDSMSSASEGAMEAAKANAQALIDQATATRDQMVSSAEGAVQAAAQRLAGASNKKEAKAALKELDKARRDLDLAERLGSNLIKEAETKAKQMIDNATSSEEQIKKASAILAAQGVLTLSNVAKLTSGLAAENATLADYAEARARVSEMLRAANQQLSDAMALRDNYSDQIANSVRSFGALVSAQAKVVDGVTQALTATDITDNLRERLEKVRTFQENLRVLLAQGLSDDAYKQLLDAGVEGGSAYVQALMDGGPGSISEVNSLIAQIGDAADGLGETASTRLYQAGVDAAQGLVDGLLSLSDELDSAATALGNAIAEAIKAALGIASPSRVTMAMMDPVGDGVVVGLDRQHTKVGTAASRLAGQIAVSPEVAAYAARQSASDDLVSGNRPSSERPVDIDLTIVTPTENPHAVAAEVINEITGRL